MYIPTPFRIDDANVVAAFMEQFAFATIVTNSEADGLVASHVPVLVRRIDSDIQLLGHVARANSHWRLLDGGSESMAIFHGPHAYVSPNWYVEPARAVPTWNYAVIHAYGRAVARDDAGFTKEVVEGLTRRYEGHRERSWSAELLPSDSYAKLLGAIVGFEMLITRCEAKFKLGQNRSAADRTGTAAGLDREQSPAAADVAEFMRRFGAGAGEEK